VEIDGHGAYTAPITDVAASRSRPVRPVDADETNEAVQTKEFRWLRFTVNRPSSPRAGTLTRELRRSV